MKKKIIIIMLTLTTSLNVCACSKTSSKYYYESAIYKIKSDDYKHAKEFMETALDLEPDKAEYHLCYGMISNKLEDYEKAISEFESVISSDDIDSEKQNKKNAYRGIGIAKLNSGLYDEALENFDKALEISEFSEMDIDILKYKVDVLLKKGSIGEIEDVCKEILKKDKDSADIYIIEGKILVAQKKYDEAKQKFDLAIQKGNKNVYYYLADLYKKQGNTMEALKMLQKYINEDSSVNKAMVYSEMATYMIEATDYNGAQKVIEKGLKLNDSRYMRVLECNEIALYEGKLDFKTAYDKAQKYVAKYPDDKNMKNEVAFLANRVGK